jgi:hypothetical protein
LAPRRTDWRQTTGHKVTLTLKLVSGGRCGVSAFRFTAHRNN